MSRKGFHGRLKARILGALSVAQCLEAEGGILVVMGIWVSSADKQSGMTDKNPLMLYHPPLHYHE